MTPTYWHLSSAGSSPANPMAGYPRIVSTTHPRGIGTSRQALRDPFKTVNAGTFTATTTVRPNFIAVRRSSLSGRPPMFTGRPPIQHWALSVRGQRHGRYDCRSNAEHLQRGDRLDKHHKHLSFSRRRHRLPSADDLGLYERLGSAPRLSFAAGSQCRIPLPPIA